MISPREVASKVAYCLLEGGLWTVVGIVICCLALPANWNQQNASSFARRWDGTCAGWDRAMAVEYIIVELWHWWGYCTIAFVLLRLHPVIKSVWSAKLTLTLMFLFILGCGVGHLLEAYSVLHPIYRHLIYYKWVNASVGYAAAVFIAISLVLTFSKISKARAKLESVLQEKGL